MTAVLDALIWRAIVPTSQVEGHFAESRLMSTDTQIRIPARLHALAATAMLLERLEQTPRGASASQYRSVVRQLGSLLDEAADEPTLPALLDSLPGLAELHENRYYADAGLCRQPLEQAVQAEQLARELLDRLRRKG